MCTKHSDTMPQGEDEIKPLNATISGRVHGSTLNISAEIPEIQRQEESSEVIKAKTLEHLQNSYPSEFRCHVYIDGSAKGATRNGGSGVYIKYPHTTSSSHSFAVVGKLASLFRAELQAIREATNILTERKTTNSNGITIISDCRAAFQSHQTEASDEVIEIILQNFGQIQTINTTSLQWISAHCGLFWNEDWPKMAHPNHSRHLKCIFWERKHI